MIDHSLDSMITSDFQLLAPHFELHRLAIYGLAWGNQQIHKSALHAYITIYGLDLRMLMKRVILKSSVNMELI